MNPFVSAAISRRLALVLGISLLGSITLGRLISDYALAATQPAARESRNPSSLPIQIMGTYKVREIIQHSGHYHGSVCVPHSPKRGIRLAPDENCGRRLWVVRQGQDVAVVQKPESAQSGTLHSFLTPSNPFHMQCDLQARPARPDVRALFETQLCRATIRSNKRPERFKAPSSEQVFYVIESNVPGRYSAFQRVIIPRGSDSPESIRVEERGRGGTLLIPTTVERTYHLEREQKVES